MPDIFDEVEEDLRAERAQALLRRYGGLLLIAAGIAVLAVAAYQAWRWYDAKQAGRVATAYIAAMREADAASPSANSPQSVTAAQAFLKVAGESRAGYRTLARLRAAALLAHQGKTPEALALWNEVVHDDAADPLLRSLANLLWVEHNLDHGDPSALQQRLTELETPDSPWHGLAREADAMLQLRLGKTEAARATLKQVEADPATPEGVRRRAAGLLVRLGG